MRSRRRERRYHLWPPAEANPLQDIVGEGDPLRFSAYFGDSAHTKLPQAELGFDPEIRKLGLCLLFIHPRAPNLISLRSAGTMSA